MATAEIETTIAVKFMLNCQVPMGAPCVVVVVGRLWMPTPDGRKMALSGALGIEWSAGFDSAKPEPSPKAFVQRNEDLVAAVIFVTTNI